MSIINETEEQKERLAAIGETFLKKGLGRTRRIKKNCLTTEKSWYSRLIQKN